jgi:hypothetical protein
MRSWITSVQMVRMSSMTSCFTLGVRPDQMACGGGMRGVPPEAE